MKSKHYTLTAIAIFAFVIAIIVYARPYKPVIYYNLAYAITDGSCPNQMQVCELEPVGTWDNTKYANSAVYFCTCEESGK